MGPLINANKRKCKIQKLVYGVHSADMEFVHSYNDIHTQKNYLRSLAFISGQK